MANVYVEPIPKGREGAIVGYVLELACDKRVNKTAYKTQQQVIKDAKSLGHKPLVARVRNTYKGNPDHWRSAD
jgi:predicted metallo-beta-lactamase superfamily hydrolase